MIFASRSDSLYRQLVSSTPSPSVRSLNVARTGPLAKLYRGTASFVLHRLCHSSYRCPTNEPSKRRKALPDGRALRTLWLRASWQDPSRFAVELAVVRLATVAGSHNVLTRLRGRSGS